MSLLILLAAYNGSAHMLEQIESIRNQTIHSWHLLVRDDGSSDDTRDVVGALAADDPRIELFEDDLGNLGAMGNFAALCQIAQSRAAEYVMFCDQDDVWLPDKIEKTLAYLQRAEGAFGREVPFLVHTDLRVVDRHLNTRHPSFMKFQHIHHEENAPIKVLLAQNFVTGCTVIFNRPLLEMTTPIPQEAILHDWWLALCAAASGIIMFVPDATVLYRQHGSNKVGAKGYWLLLNPLQTNYLTRWWRNTKYFLQSIAQARALLARMEERGGYNEGETVIVRRYCAIWSEEISRFRRLSSILELGVKRQDRLLNLLLWLRCVLMSSRVMEGRH